LAGFEAADDINCSAPQICTYSALTRFSQLPKSTTELVKSVTQLTKFVMELVKSVTDLSLSGSNLVFSVANEITFGSDQGFSTRDFVKSMPDQGTFPPEEGDTQRNKMPIRPESWRNLSGEIAFETDFLIGPVPANIGAQWRSERHHGDVAGFFQGS
jgi:hypothetical protein